MTDKKLTQLPEATTLTDTDILPVVVDPVGLPETQKITVDNFRETLLKVIGGVSGNLSSPS